MYVFVFYFGGGDIMSAKIKNMATEVLFVNNANELRVADATGIYKYVAHNPMQRFAQQMMVTILNSRNCNK